MNNTLVGCILVVSLRYETGGVRVKGNISMGWSGSFYSYDMTQGQIFKPVHCRRCSSDPYIRIKPLHCGQSNVSTNFCFNRTLRSNKSSRFDSASNSLTLQPSKHPHPAYELSKSPSQQNKTTESVHKFALESRGMAAKGSTVTLYNCGLTPKLMPRQSTSRIGEKSPSHALSSSFVKEIPNSDFHF